MVGEQALGLGQQLALPVLRAGLLHHPDRHGQRGQNHGDQRLGIAQQRPVHHRGQPGADRGEHEDKVIGRGVMVEQQRRQRRHQPDQR